MFRSMIVGGCIALLLSACNATTGGIDVKRVQDTAISICKFEPTATTVLNIFSSGSPLLDSVSEIANAICQAVNTPRSTGELPKVNNVVVQGRRV